MTFHLCTEVDGRPRADCIDLRVSDTEQVGRCVITAMPQYWQRWIEQTIRENKPILDRLALDD